MADYPPAPKLRLVQSVATGVELIDLAALPKGCTMCNSFGHETAIAEYVVMTMLACTIAFRDRRRVPRARLVGDELGAERRAAWRGARLDARHRRLWPGRAGGGAPRGAVRLPHPRRQPQPARGRAGVERVYPLAALDEMLPLCDTVAICTALGPETTGLIDARRLALMKPGAFLINIARGQVIDEDALYAALRDGKLGGAAIDVWWQYPNADDPTGAARATRSTNCPM